MKKTLIALYVAILAMIGVIGAQSAFAGGSTGPLPSSRVVTVTIDPAFMADYVALRNFAVATCLQTGPKGKEVRTIYGGMAKNLERKLAQAGDFTVLPNGKRSPLEAPVYTTWVNATPACVPAGGGLG